MYRYTDCNNDHSDAILGIHIAVMHTIVAETWNTRYLQCLIQWKHGICHKHDYIDMLKQCICMIETSWNHHLEMYRNTAIIIFEGY